ncbi:YhgE/Pip domain-containing protein [Isoptericola variabilis]|uniref:YhgE/Pip N-terminal domain protein n=1 Tax=Isoptericola variabilis (strain 225) TaxID=743718 RepID=F6FSC4_ISOV2|nr:YhgE/Pip domain-containing protein [Isoptericola variabilis]AEG43065.1 YhgE/Pip N-terminal domain protein [Isoptericola variabilis 225]
MTAPITAGPARSPRRDAWRITAVALLPILVLGLLLAALWNPMERLGTVRAAIVNLDEPVELDGQLVPLGRQLAAGLVAGENAGQATDGSAEAVRPAGTNYAWEVTDADRARAGLDDGTYAAVVTIPEDFSAAATSFGGDDAGAARKATIDVATPEGGRVVDDALARIVATTATSVMSSTLTETYVDNVLIGFDTLAEGIGEAADGAGQLADGAGEAADGASQLADGAGQLADGAGEASSVASQLASGATQLAGGATEASSGAAQLAGGASQLANGAREASTGASQLADGAGQVADGTSQLAGGVGQSADGAHQLADGLDALAAGAGDAVAGADELAGGLDALAAGTAGLPEQTLQSAAAVRDVADALGAYVALGCTVDPSTDACAQIDLVEIQAGAAGLAAAIEEGVGDPGSATSPPTGLYALTAGIAQSADGAAALAGAPATENRPATGLRALQGGVGQSAAGAEQLAGGLDQLDAAAGQLATGASGVAAGASGLADGVGQLATGASGFAAGASGLADGVGQLATGASGVATGASGLADGVGQLGTGAGELATGTEGLADGVGQLADGAGKLADGLDEATEQIPAYSESERQNLASVVADPVAAPGVDDLSTGATGPLFAVVALWLGALGLLTVFPPVVARALGSTRGSVRLTLEAARVPALVGLGTGAVVGGILAVVEDASLLSTVGAVVVGALVSLCFVAVHQGFLGWLGDLGRGISLLIAVLLIGTGVVATVPDVLVGLADLLPTGAARDALLAVVVPGVGGIASAITWLVLWTLAGLALAVGATARSRRTRVAALLRA